MGCDLDPRAKDLEINLPFFPNKRPDQVTVIRRHRP
jgi:hypothetical protein